MRIKFIYVTIILSKPEKVYLDNTNLAFALGGERVEVGAQRETFCASQPREAGHLVETHSSADFIVDGKYIFEVGGPSKKSVQVRGLKESYLVCDGINQGGKSKVPLWMLGFLY